MKGLIALVFAAVLVGCGDTGGPEVKTAEPLNPSGKPRNAQEAAIASAQQKAGQAMNDRMAAAAAAANAARTSGGK